MKNEFEVAFNEIAELRALPRDIVLEALRTALISAYRRDSNASAAQRVEATIDPNTGRAKIFVEKEVVESVENPRTEVDLEKARYYEPEVNLGDMAMVQVEGTTKKFGRIAAQTAKQVILQKIREAERNTLFEEFSGKEGDVTTATVQSISAGAVTVSLGRAEAVMPRKEQIPGERYKPHDKVRVYIQEVKKTNRGPNIVVSRAHRNFLRRLLEFEVPEIYNGQVEIKNIAREAGHRSKVAVVALQDGIDPVGACVGMRGVRIQNIVKELHDEKIDVIEWNPNQEDFIKKALSPARVTGVYLEDDPDIGRTAVVIVPDDQLSLAIGREGQNARLAAKLTGWRIDIKSVAEAVQDALNRIDLPALADVKAKHAATITQVQGILEKKAASRVVAPEEYKTMEQFADMVERRLVASRDQARKARLAEINAVRSTLPARAFQMPVESLDLPDSYHEALQPMQNVGEIMLRFLIDENRLKQLLNSQGKDALQRLQDALDKLVIPAMEEEIAAPEVAAATAPMADGDEAPMPVGKVEERATKVDARQPQPAPVVESFSFDEEDDFSVKSDDKKKKKKGKQGKTLYYDEERGDMRVQRNRKGSRQRGAWDDDDD